MDYWRSNSLSLIRLKTVKPACLALETEVGAKSFGVVICWIQSRVTACPQVGQAVRAGSEAACRWSKPSPQSLQGALRGT